MFLKGFLYRTFGTEIHSHFPVIIEIDKDSLATQLTQEDLSDILILKIKTLKEEIKKKSKS